MPTKLERLLDAIDPDRTLEETFNRANQAINTFDGKAAQIDKWDDFRHCIAEFLRYVDTCVLRLRRPLAVSSDYYWSRSVRILLKLYGIQGEKAAFEMARTGNEGGLYGVLKAVAMKAAEEYSENEITARIGSYWQGFSVDEQLEACDEYLAKYGHLLASELTEASAARIRANFPKVLQQHPHLISKTRQVGR